jgi:uncharacterized Zn finger protein
MIVCLRCGSSEVLDASLTSRNYRLTVMCKSCGMGWGIDMDTGRMRIFRAAGEEKGSREWRDVPAGCLFVASWLLL